MVDFPFLARPSRRSGLAARTFTVGLMKPGAPIGASRLRCSDQCSRPEGMPIWRHSDDLPVVTQPHVRCTRQEARIERNRRARVVIDVEALDPRFLVARVTDMAAGLRHPDSARTQTSRGSSVRGRSRTPRAVPCIEFRGRAAVAEQDGADVFSAWKEEESRRNLLRGAAPGRGLEATRPVIPAALLGAGRR